MADPTSSRVHALGVGGLEGPLRILAGPGTGKTQLLVDLYADLVAGRRAARGEILVLTFSTAAAEEIGHRIDRALRDSYDRAWISTFHSFCARLLREHRPDAGRLLLSGFQEQIAMRQVLSEMDQVRLGGLAAVAGSGAFAQDALGVVALLKQNRVPPGELLLLAEAAGTARLRALAEIYLAYQARLGEAGLRDFRDLVSDAVALLEARPDVLAGLQERFRYVLVDEFQDVDPAQFHLLRTLAPPEAGPKLLVVGDPDQSIYGFRGTLPGLLSEDFPRVYGHRSLSLEASHRCPPPVLEAAGRLLAATQPGRRVALTSRRQESTPAVRLVQEATAGDEAAFVAREIRRLLLERPGLRPGQVALLLRSTATLSAPFEEALRALGLAYEVRGVGTVARNEVVRFLLTYLRALVDPGRAVEGRLQGRPSGRVAQPDDALERLLGSGLSGVGQRAAGRLRRHAIEEGRAFPRVVRRLIYWLHQEDPESFPLPWPADAGAQAGGAPGQPPDYLAFLSREEQLAIHGAVTAFYRLRRRARHLSLHPLAYEVLLEAGVMARLLPLEEPDRQRALDDVRAALHAFEELEEVWGRLRGAPPQLADVAGELDAWVTRALDETEPAPKSRDAVQIMTVHQSKGLEFEVVFLGGFARGLFPLAAQAHPVLDPEDQAWLVANLSGFRPAWPSEPAQHLAEEARAAYVGMTRARDLLYLTFADEYSQPAGPSPFVELAVPGAGATRYTRAEAVEPGSVLTRSEAETLLAGRPLEEATKQRLTDLGVDVEWVTDPQAGEPFRPYQEPPVGVDPGHFSPTTLNDYLLCPRLYFYKHHPGVAAPPRGVVLERGSFLHRVLEDFHDRETEWRTEPPELQREWLERALERHLAEYLDRVENVLDRKREEQEVRRILANYIEFATQSHEVPRRGTLLTEKKFFLNIEGAEVRGKIDRVVDTGTGSCEVVDYKTGRGYSIARTYDRYFGPEAYDVQLAMYYLACREGVDEDGRALNLEPRFLSLWYPKEWVYGSIRQSLFPVGGPLPGVSDRKQRPLGEGDLARGRARAAGAIRRILAGDFAPQPRPETVGTCLSWSGCDHAAICPYGGQRSE